MVREFSGVAISLLYCLAKSRHCAGECAFCADCTVVTLGARFGYQRSCQFWEENGISALLAADAGRFRFGCLHSCDADFQA